MRSRAIPIALIGCLAAVLLIAPIARAAYDPLGGGTTKLVLDKSFAAFLEQDGITLTTKDGAKRKGTSYLLPISGGAFDPLKGKGEIDNEGVLAFQSQKKSVPLRNITLKTKHSPLIAKVGGSQLKLATSAKLSFKREGFDSSFAAQKLKLTAKLITRLNKKLRPKLSFEEGQLLGTILSQTAPKLTAVEAKNTATLVFNAAFMTKLDQRFVSLNPIFPAEHQGATFILPLVAGGLLAPDGSEGELRTGGTLEFLQLGAGQVFWKELWLDFATHSDTAEVDVEPTPSFPGKLSRVGVLDLGATSVSSDPGARTISAANAPLTLSSGAASTFNQAFAQGGPSAFSAGEGIGTLSFTAQGQ